MQSYSHTLSDCHNMSQELNTCHNERELIYNLKNDMCVTSHTRNQNLPGKAASPWEGLPATKTHAWGLGDGCPYLVHGERIPVVPLSSLTPPFVCFRLFFGSSGSFLPGFRLRPTWLLG